MPDRCTCWNTPGVGHDAGDGIIHCPYCAQVHALAREAAATIEGLARAYKSVMFSEFETRTNTNPLAGDEDYERAEEWLARAKELGLLEPTLAPSAPTPSGSPAETESAS